MSSSNNVPDPESILTVVDPRPEEEVLEQYATESLQTNQFAEKTTVEDPEAEESAEMPAKKKKGGGLKMVLIGCVGLGCLGVIVLAVLAAGGVGAAWFIGSSGGGLALPEVPSMPDVGGGEIGDETGEGDADASSGEEQTGDEATGQEDGVAEETPPPVEVVEVERPTPAEVVVSVEHQAATMSFVGDNLALSASTPGYSRCKVIVVYRGGDGGSWKKQSMTRNGESHSTALTVTGEMSPEFRYYLTVSNCGTGRAPAGGGSYTVGVF